MIAQRLIIALVFIVSPTLLHGDPVNGMVKSVFGEATLVTERGQSEKLEIGMSVSSGSRIETAVNGTVVVEWLSGAYSILMSDSSVAVSSLDLGKTADGRPGSRVTLDLLKGDLLCHLTQNGGTSDFTVKTLEGVAAAHGTDWVVAIHGHSIQVETFTSTVTFTLPSGKVIRVRAGMVYNAGADNAVPLTQDEIETFIETLKDTGFSVTKFGQGGYVITYTPPNGEIGFTFSVKPVAENETQTSREPLGKSPLPASDFTPPPVDPTSP
jgi:FecR protein